MKKLLLATLLLSIFSCSEKETTTDSIVDGTINNTTEDTLRIRSGEFTKDIKIADDGSFADTLAIEKNGYYNLFVGRERTAVYLEKGKNLSVSLDADKFDETIAYSGDLSKENNYLAKKYLAAEETLDIPKLYSASEKDFIATLNRFKKNEDSLLMASAIKNQAFVTAEKKELEYEYASKIETYENYHKYYSETEDFKVSEGFYNSLKNIDFADTTAYRNSSAYQQMIETHYSRLAEASSNENDTDYSLPFLKQLDANLPDGYAKDKLMSNYLQYSLQANESMEQAYAIYKNSNPDPENLKKITERYNTVKVLTKGSPSPTFAYENNKGGTTSLADLKGKNVYIDVWATWCGPCIREIPHLKEIEEEYSGKDIAFISISIDVQKDHDKWKKMIEAKELGGTQLFADNNWKSKFVTDYAISGIPRFILIDKEGNIVSANAPRPSSDAIGPLFDSVL